MGGKRVASEKQALFIKKKGTKSTSLCGAMLKAPVTKSIQGQKHVNRHVPTQQLGRH